MTDGLRERKKVATRHRLHEAALRLVARRGLDAVSVDDIAEAAGVSPRTFFNYFPTKDDAVIGLDPTRPDDLAEVFSARPPDESPVASLRAVVRARASEMAVDTGIWTLRLPVIEGHPVLGARLAAHFAAAEDALAAAIADRTGTTAGVDVYPSLLAAVQGTVMRVSLHRWLIGEFTRTLPDLVDEAWDVVAAGLPAPPSDLPERCDIHCITTFSEEIHVVPVRRRPAAGADPPSRQSGLRRAAGRNARRESRPDHRLDRDADDRR